MSSLVLVDEQFNAVPNSFSWQHPPKQWTVENGKLRVEATEGSDNWCRTHYDWGIHDSAHFYYVEIPDDNQNILIETKVTYFPHHQYDQAGLMIRRGPDSWVKTSCEYEVGEPARLGSVVTNHGFSDWATQAYHVDSQITLSYRIYKYHTNDVCIMTNTTPDQSPDKWTQIRIARFFPLTPTDARDEGLADGKLRVGLYFCGPLGPNFVAEFDYFKISVVEKNPSQWH